MNILLGFGIEYIVKRNEEFINLFLLARQNQHDNQNIKIVSMKATRGICSWSYSILLR